MDELGENNSLQVVPATEPGHGRLTGLRVSVYKSSLQLFGSKPRRLLRPFFPRSLNSRLLLPQYPQLRVIPRRGCTASDSCSTTPCATGSSLPSAARTPTVRTRVTGRGGVASTIGSRPDTARTHRCSLATRATPSRRPRCTGEQGERGRQRQRGGQPDRRRV